MPDVYINLERVHGKRNPMIYGHFIEHFHRQIYGGIYCPDSPSSDQDGFRIDVINALNKISPPIIRWPGGCFVSSYHWRYGVGNRKPIFDKAWRVEEPNTFGTDEFIKLCRKIGSEPYICTNAGTGTAEEMSDWVEYCNLQEEGSYAKQRIANGHKKPYNVKYWSIGNENYGAWEIGAKTVQEWSLLVTEAAKMMKRVDPQIQLSAAALADVDWNLALLSNAGEYLDWISIHEYWDAIHQTNALATYEETMAYTAKLDDSIRKVEGILEATGFQDKIKISFDEWNLRGWYHPNSHTKSLPVDKSQYITPRDKNDDNSSYTMADTIFTACFLNTLLRHCNTVRMANFAPTVNTRGMIFTHPHGIVLRGTYHVFDLFVNCMGETVVDLWNPKSPDLCVKDKWNNKVTVPQLDMVATLKGDKDVAISIINKDANNAAQITFHSPVFSSRNWKIMTICGNHVDDYNDIDNPNNIQIKTSDVTAGEIGVSVNVSAHSVNVLTTCP